MRPSSAFRTLAFALAILHLTAGSSPLQGQILKEVSRGAANQWQITWTSKLGVEYTVQRSIDLQNWIDIGTVTANATEASFVDTEAPATVRNFWRLRYDDGGVGVLTPFSIIEVARVDAQGNVLPPNSSEGSWRISWESEAGASYTVQRSADGLSWADLATITATAEVTRYVDSSAPPAPRLLWRVMAMTTTGGGVEISKILPQLSSPGGGSATSLGVMINSNTPVVSVQFYNGGTLLGSGSPGLGNIWSFPLSWDPNAPEVIQLVLQVDLQDGEPVRTDPVGLLRADPSKFAPLTETNEKSLENGVPNFGTLVGADPSGALDAFAYYPEGIGEREGSTGAHFRFEAGATIGSQGNGSTISFSTANFYRGSLDPAPLPARAGTQVLVLGAIDATSVTSSFTVPAGGPLQLLWGGAAVEWNSGTLDEEGWEGLFITPRLWQFALPGLQAQAEISIDPDTGEPNLIASFSGSWNPIPESGITFEVPVSDPIKIYQPLRGLPSAGGTVDVSFPDGAKVRGSVAWSNPNLEVRIEGRGLTIPAVGFLKPELPADPTVCLPAGDTDAELDEAAACLAAYRNAFRSVASASLNQAPTDTNGTFTPPPVPVDPAGSTLRGWAARVESWNGDRQGETLGPEASQQLLTAVSAATKTAEAARDLTTVIQLLHDFLKIREGFTTVLHATTVVPDEFFERAQASLLSSAQRVVREAPTIAIDTELPRFASLLAAIAARFPDAAGAPLKDAPRAPRKGDPPSSPVRNILMEVRERVTADLLNKGTGATITGIDPNNGALQLLSTAKLLGILEGIAAAFQLLEQEGVPFADPRLGSRCLQLNQPVLQILFPEALDALEEVRLVLVRRLSQQAQDAMAAADQEVFGYESYQLLRAAVDDYARFFKAYHALWFAQEQDSLAPPAQDLVARFTTAATYWDYRIDPDLRGSSAIKNLLMVRSIALTTLEGCDADRATQIAGLNQSRKTLETHNERMIKSFIGNFNCDELRVDLNSRLNSTNALTLDPQPGERLVDIPTLPASVAAGENLNGSIRLTGQFASILQLQPTPRKTLQLSQAGAYLTGYLQTQLPGQSLQGDRLRGVLISSAPDELKFGYLRFNDLGIIQGAGTLTATQFEENLDGELVLQVLLTLEEKPEFAGGQPSTGQYIRVGREAPLSDRFIDALKPPAQNGTPVHRPAVDVLRAQQRAPLHPATLSDVRGYVNGNGLPGDDPGGLPLTALIDLAHSANNADGTPLGERKDTRAQQIDDRIGAILSSVSTEHIPLIRTLLNEYLTKEDIPGFGGQLNYWGRLIEVFAEQINPQNQVIGMPNTGSLLGLVDGGTLDQSKVFRYDIRISRLDVGLPGILGLGLQASALEFRVIKTTPEGNSNAGDPWVFAGLSGQIGAEISKSVAKILPLATSALDVSVESLFDYTIQDFLGGFSVVEVAAQVRTEIGGTLGPSMSSIFIYPELGKPPLVIDPGKADNQFTLDAGLKLSASFSVKVDFGWLFPYDTESGAVISSHGLFDSVLELEAEANADFALQLSFAENSDQLTPCGWQALREWLAEFRNPLESPDAKITVIGFTDTREDNSEVNDLDLSERRAATVRQAMEVMLGLGADSPQSNVLSFGLGELAALDSVPDWQIRDQLPSESIRTRDLVVAQRTGRKTPDSTPSKYWRQVLIIVNDTVALRLDGEIEEGN